MWKFEKDTWKYYPIDEEHADNSVSDKKPKRLRRKKCPEP